MTLYNPSLRARFLGATVVLTVVLLAGFAYAMHLFIETLEDELVRGPLEEELTEFAQRFREDPTNAAPTKEDVKSYTVPRGETASLPTPLRSLRPGEMTQIEIGTGDYIGGRRDVGATSLYLLLDIDEVEKLEARLVAVAWICGLGALALAMLIAFWLARLVIRPVRRLAEQVAAIEPGQPRPALAPGVRDASLALIADRFDRTLERFDAYVAREQAFTEDASHELRTPLAVIRSASELLAADSSLSPKASQRVQRIQNAARQAQELVEALLFLAREDGGVGEEAAYPLEQAVREAADLYLAEAENKGLHLRIHEQACPDVNAPYGLLISIISNLLRNAVSHTSFGGVDIHIRRDRLVIEDTGTGVDPAALGRIFEKRVRGPQSRGQGLGLYLVRRLCQRLGWRVTVANRDTGGARFSVAFDGQQSSPSK